MHAGADVAEALDGLALPEDSAERIRAAHAALVSGHPKRCVEGLEQLGAVDGAAVPYLLGLAHLARGDLYRAGTAFEQAATLDPSLFRARLQLAHVYEAREDYPRAAEVLRAALQLQPDEPAAIAALARCSTRMGRLERAEALARRGLELDAESPALLRALADTLGIQGRHAEAAAALRLALPRAEGDEAVHVALGRSLLDLDRPDEARPIFEAVLRRNADSTEALAGMAEALEREGRLSEAHGYVLRAMAAAPDRAALHLLHARINLASGRLDAAEGSASMAATLEPNNPGALRLALRAVQAQRRHADAVEYAGRLLKTAHGDLEALAALAVHEVLDGRPESAWRRVEPALVRGEDAPDLQLAAGCALLASGRAAEAAERFKDVVRLRADDPLAQLLLGLAYRCDHDPQTRARAALAHILNTGEAPEDDDHDDDDDDDNTAVVEADAAIPGGPLDPVTSELPRSVTGPIAPLVEAAVRALLAEDPSPPPARSWADPDPGASHEFPDAPPSFSPGDREPTRPEIDLPADFDVGALAPPTPTPRRRAHDVRDRLPIFEPDSQPPGLSLEMRTGRPVDVSELLHPLRRVLLSEPAFADLVARVEGLLETHDKPLGVAVLGPRRAGKTTFVNALIGEEVIGRETEVPHRLRYGRRAGARVVYHDGRAETLPLEELVAQSRERRLTADKVAHVEVLMPVEELTRVSIIDAPDPFDDAAAPLVARADAVVWLGGVDQGDAPWQQAIAWLDRHPVAAIAVVTRADMVDVESLERRRLATQTLLGGRVAAVVAVSARRGLHGLRNRDVNALRASGFTRLHRALRTHFFSRAGVIRGDAVARRSDRIHAEAKERVAARLERVSTRADSVDRLAARIADDRERFRHHAEAVALPQLKGALERALEECAGDLEEIRRDNPGSFGRIHLLDALRSRLRRGFADAVGAVRARLDSELGGLVDDYFEAFDKVFPTHEDAAQSARIAGLQGIIEGYRQLLLEEAFGRHEAYLDGWVDQAPLETLIEAGGVLAAPPGGGDQPIDLQGLVDELRVRGLRLEQARMPRLEGLGDAIFDGLAEFLGETAAEQRVARVDLEKRLLEPLDRLK